MPVPADLYELGRANDDPAAFDAEIDRTQPGDLAVLIYTSGTTGDPKGVMLTQENIVAGMEASLYALPFEKGAEQLCFLPLCHILERLVSLYTPLIVSTHGEFRRKPRDRVRQPARGLAARLRRRAARLGKDLFPRH
jgi:long-chain acyl-CoA synthetase